MDLKSTLSSVVDALDMETYLVCSNKEEGGRIGISMMKALGFKDVDIVFVGYANGGARVRLRAYIHKPGDVYAWNDGYGDGEE